MISQGWLAAACERHPELFGHRTVHTEATGREASTARQTDSETNQLPYSLEFETQVCLDHGCINLDAQKLYPLPLCFRLVEPATSGLALR